jgi:hypothetical protein
MTKAQLLELAKMEQTLLAKGVNVKAGMEDWTTEDGKEFQGMTVSPYDVRYKYVPTARCSKGSLKHVDSETGKVHSSEVPIMCSPCYLGLCSYWHCINCPIRKYLVLYHKILK